MDESIFDRLSDEIASRGDFTQRAPTTTAISVPVATLDSLVKTVKELKSEVDRMAGRSGSVADKALTLRDLVTGGALSITLGGNTYESDPGDVIVTVPGSGDPRPYYDPPPTPTGLGASAAFKTVVVDWTLVEYQNHAYVEIWRNTVDVIGTAVKIGECTANVYTDNTGATGTTYYYWVRAVNLEGHTGSFNALSGVPATLLSIDTADYQNLSIVNAAIGNLAVDNAKIANATITDAKIANVSADKITAGSIAVGQYIQSTGYSAGTSGFRISGNGNVEFNTGTFRGALSAATGTFAGSLSAATGSFAGSLTAASGTFSGTLTASAINAVDTINLAGQAVTIPTSTYTAGNITIPTGVDTTVQTITFTSTGAPVLILAGCAMPISTDPAVFFNIWLKRNGTILTATNGPTDRSQMFNFTPYTDTPGAGSVTYTLVINWTSGTQPSWQVSGRSLFAIEVKR